MWFECSSTSWNVCSNGPSLVASNLIWIYSNVILGHAVVVFPWSLRQNVIWVFTQDMKFSAHCEGTSLVASNLMWVCSEELNHSTHCSGTSLQCPSKCGTRCGGTSLVAYFLIWFWFVRKYWMSVDKLVVLPRWLNSWFDQGTDLESTEYQCIHSWYFLGGLHPDFIRLLIPKLLILIWNSVVYINIFIVVVTFGWSIPNDQSLALQAMFPSKNSLKTCSIVHIKYSNVIFR